MKIKKIMKKKYSLLLLLFISICCKTDKNEISETIKSDYIEEMTQVNTRFNKYVNNNYFALYSLGQYDFTKKIDSLRGTYTTLINQYKGKLDESIIKDDFLTVNATFYQKILEYPNQHKKFTGENVLISKKNQETIDNFSKKFNDASLLSNKNFRKFTKYYITIESRKKLKSHIYDTLDNQQLTADWNTIETLFKNQDVSDFWKQEYLYDHIDNIGIKNIDAFYTNFITTCKKTDYTTKINEIYNLQKKRRTSHRIETYKRVNGFELDMHLFLPDPNSFNGNRPTIVQFHGGSWSIGNPDWFFGTAEEYAKQGWIVAVVEYRIKARQGTYPFEAVKDAKSAIRWLRENAKKYKIDPNKILATGNSAGGHLALATTLTTYWNEKTDNLTISAKPNSLIVNAAVYDLTDNNTKWIVENLENKEVVKEISPNHLMKKTITKMLLIHGDKDRNCPYDSATHFYQKMKSLGNNIELYTIQGGYHRVWYGKHYTEVAKVTREYIQKLNYN